MISSHSLAAEQFMLGTELDIINSIGQYPFYITYEEVSRGLCGPEYLLPANRQQALSKLKELAAEATKKEALRLYEEVKSKKHDQLIKALQHIQFRILDPYQLKLNELVDEKELAICSCSTEGSSNCLSHPLRKLLRLKLRNVNALHYQ
jgi:hypothetical protein